MSTTRPLDLLQSATEQLAAHAESLVALGRELDNLPRLSRDWLAGPADGVPVRSDLVESSEALVDAWWGYTDVLRPSATVSMKRTARGFGLSPWEEIDKFAQQASAGDIRMIVGDDPLDDASDKALRHLIDHGMQIRVMHAPPTTFFTTADGTSALSMVWDSDWPQSMLVLRSEPVARTLKAWYESMWAVAVPYGRDGSAWEAVLDLLDQGLDDDAIAARLGWSTRTVRRRVSDAMDDLGVDSRFALGRAWALTRR